MPATRRRWRRSKRRASGWNDSYVASAHNERDLALPFDGRGTRLAVGFDEPEEHWAPPDSLDPTPVWKQYILVVLLGAGVFVFAIVYAYIALLPDVVSPPAVLPGALTLTVAVKVTACPADTGFGMEVTAVLVAARYTVCATLPLLLRKLLSPL